MVVQINNLGNGVMEYLTDKGAIVRIHDGKLTDDERKVVLENAAKDFYRAIQKAQKKKAQ